MTTHILVQGGQRTFNDQYAMFPGTLSGLTDNLGSPANKGPSRYAETRVLDFDAGSLVTNLSVPKTISPESWGSMALSNYVKSVAQVASGDVLQVLELPKFSQLVGLHWFVAKTLASGTAVIRVNGRAASIAGNLNLKTGIDLTTVGSGVLSFPKSGVFSGNEIYFDQNDILEVVISSQPANTTGSDGKFAGGVQGLALFVTPVIEMYVRGAF